MLGFLPISVAPISWIISPSLLVDATAPGAVLTGTSSITTGGASGNVVIDAIATGVILNGVSSIYAGVARSEGRIRPIASVYNIMQIDPTYWID